MKSLYFGKNPAAVHQVVAISRILIFHQTILSIAYFSSLRVCIY